MGHICFFNGLELSLSVILVLVCSLANVTQLRPAGVHGWLQVAAIETAVSETDIFASSTCDFNFITLVHVTMLIERNTGHFDNEIDFADSEGLEGTKVATASLPSGFRPTRTTSTLHLIELECGIARSKLNVCTRNKQFPQVSRLKVFLHVPRGGAGFKREFYEHELSVSFHTGWLFSVFENPSVMRGGTRHGLDNGRVIGVLLFTSSHSSPVKSEC